MTNYLGKTRLYELVKDRVGDFDQIVEASGSYYDKGSDYECLKVYGCNYDFKLCVAYGGSCSTFSVFDKNYNRLFREINGYTRRSLNMISI